MSEESSQPILYRVSYSGRVREELRRLAAVARGRGVSEPFVTALKELDRLLHLYPQFGDPLCDLKLKPAQLWIGAVPPLAVRYTLDDERRIVMVVAPFLLLPKLDA